jgi:hypothetical protein
MKTMAYKNPVVVRVERPRARRYPFVASAELFDLQSEVQVQGRVTDLSLYGCGVAASKSFPAGTKLRIRVHHKGRAFSVVGKVAYATSNGERGDCFYWRSASYIAAVGPDTQFLIAA